MTERNLKAEGEQSDRDRQHADRKIDAQKKRMTHGSPSDQQKTNDQQLMNEMRGNKATLDLNRALFDHDAEDNK